MYEKLNVAVLGAGFAAHARAMALNKIEKDRVNISGVFDKNEINAGKFAKEFGIKKFNSFEEILRNDSINAVSICIPNRFHFNAAQQALKSDKNVICEYPLTVEGPASAEKLFAIANKRKLFIHVGQTMNFDSDLQVVIQKKNLLGKLYIGYKYMSFGKPGSWFVEAGFDSGYQNLGEWYIKNDLTGGWIIAACYHGIQILRKIFGEVKTVSSVDTMDNCIGAGSVLMEHLDGASSVVQWGLAMEGMNFNILIVTGSKGSIEINNNKFELGAADIKDTGTLQDVDTFYEDSEMLIDKLDGKIDIDNENVDMLRNLKVSFLAQRAALEKKCVKINF